MNVFGNWSPAVLSYTRFRNSPAQVSERNPNAVQRSRPQPKPLIARRGVVLDFYRCPRRRRSHRHGVRKTLPDLRQLGVARQILPGLPQKEKCSQRFLLAREPGDLRNGLLARPVAFFGT